MGQPRRGLPPDEVKARAVTVVRQGRHRHHAGAGPAVAAVVAEASKAVGGLVALMQ